MNDDSNLDLARLAALVTVTLENALKIQETLLTLTCRELGLSSELKETMISEMNKGIGIKKI